jgi:hypothetical protein
MKNINMAFRRIVNRTFVLNFIISRELQEHVTSVNITKVLIVVKYSPLYKNFSKMRDIFTNNLQHNLGIHKEAFENSCRPL